ncbi:MAG TPA: hypothetical protein PKL53_09190 [Methylotenera sp.]|nr:hypothetical protein [Methylotenera sp.]HPV44477.1 hypothetical protein [Methylotenera sp.]
MLAAFCLLSGCLGGTVAQQIARSIATSVADKAVAKAMDVDEGSSNREPKSIKLKDTQPDDVWVAMATSGFQEVKPIAEPLPEQAEETETPIQVIQSSKLVRVELFNLLIGEEKAAVYEKARLMGATSLPKQQEWQRWAVATGAIKSSAENENGKKIITFLIPPDFGKLPSGAIAVVELATPGELNVARYKTNEDKAILKAPANRFASQSARFQLNY